MLELSKIREYRTQVEKAIGAMYRQGTPENMKVNRELMLQFFVLDEILNESKKTNELLEQLIKSNSNIEEEPDKELEVLRKKAKELKIKGAHNMGVDKLKEAIDKKEGE